MTADIRSKVAEKALCWWEGRKTRAIREKALGGTGAGEFIREAILHGGREEQQNGHFQAKVPAPVSLKLQSPNQALAATASWVDGVALASSPFAFCPALRMSMPPLKKAPSSIEMRAATTSPVSEPSLRISTRSLAVRLPRTLPSTTISRALMLAATTPFRPTVTRFPERLMEPSTRPSMYSDSEPVTSPLITRDLPMVAWSAVAVVAATGRDAGAVSAAVEGVVGVGIAGRSGSPGRPGVVG